MVQQNPWAVIPATGVAVSAVFIYGFRPSLLGYAILVVSVAGAWLVSRELFKDLLLVALGMVIVSSISVEADISWGNIALMGSVLTLALAVPFFLDRKVYRHRTIQFPTRTGRRWTRIEKGYLVLVLFLGWALLPVVLHPLRRLPQLAGCDQRPTSSSVSPPG